MRFICKVCGTEVVDNPSGRRKYCSDDCCYKQNRLRAREKGREKAREKEPYSPINCKYEGCQRKFVPTRSTQKFCCKECGELHPRYIPLRKGSNKETKIPKKFLVPRGSKQRKELGLEPCDFMGSKH